MEIVYAGCYTRPETKLQTLSFFMLCLITGGFDYMRFLSQDGHLLKTQVKVDGGGSFLLLIPPGITLDFSAGKKRENWVAMLELSGAEYERDTLNCVLNTVPLTPVIKLAPQQLCNMREIFSAAVRHIANGYPAGREKAKLLLGALLAELMPVPDSGEVHSPVAAAMKKAIDADCCFQYTVRELNEKLGCCSLPYMRKIFYDEYGILPGRYRNVRRMNRIMELFAQSDLSLKMIAGEVGMKHLTHLYAFLRNEQDLSPKELLEQIRGKKNPGSGS